MSNSNISHPNNILQEVNSATSSSNYFDNHYIDHDLQLKTVIYTLLFNLICASLYIIVFILSNKCSHKSQAYQPQNRTISFFQRREEEQEKMILNDILLQDSSAKIVMDELNIRKQSMLTNDISVDGSFFEVGAEVDIIDKDMVLVSESDSDDDKMEENKSQEQK